MLPVELWLLGGQRSLFGCPARISSSHALQQSLLPLICAVPIG